MSNVHLAATAALAFLLTPAAAQQVWTVDDDGAGAAFTSIQAAIDAAAPGDVIVVREGDYVDFTLSGKGVSIVADEGAAVRVLGVIGSNTTTVSGVPAGQRAMIRGITFQPPDDVQGNSLRIETCAGVVWVEDVVVAKSTGFFFVYFLSQAEAMKVLDCAQVVLVNSQMQGNDGAIPGNGLEVGSPGLTVENSTVYAHGCQINAGQTIVQGGMGLPAMRARGRLTVLRDCALQGATGGGPGPLGIPPPPGMGGPGIEIDDGGLVWSIGTDLLGGPGGPSFGFGENGEPGVPSSILDGTLLEAEAATAMLTSNRVIRDRVPDDEVQFDLQSVPGSTVFLLARLFDSAPLFVGGLSGFLGVGANPIITTAGTTDASGQLTMTIGIPMLPPFLATWNATAQMAVVTPEQVLELSNPTVFTVVDDAF